MSRHARAGPSAAQQAAMNAACDKLTRDTSSTFVILGRGIQVADLPAQASAIDMAWLLARDHMLMPNEAADAMDKCCKGLMSTVDEWDGGDTSLGNELWEELPKQLRAAATALRAKRWLKAYGILHGLVEFHDRHENHVHDNELHCDPSTSGLMAKWFKDLSARWRELLARSDDELGLAPAGGLAGGYRPRLLRVLAEWQLRMNRTLDGVEAGDEEEGEAPRVDIMPDAQAAELAPSRKRDRGDDGDDEDEEEEE